MLRIEDILSVLFFLLKPNLLDLLLFVPFDEILARLLVAARCLRTVDGESSISPDAREKLVEEPAVIPLASTKFLSFGTSDAFVLAISSAFVCAMFPEGLVGKTQKPMTMKEQRNAEL